MAPSGVVTASGKVGLRLLQQSSGKALTHEQDTTLRAHVSTHRDRIRTHRRRPSRRRGEACAARSATGNAIAMTDRRGPQLVAGDGPGPLDVLIWSTRRGGSPARSTAFWSRRCPGRGPGRASRATLRTGWRGLARRGSGQRRRGALTRGVTHARRGLRRPAGRARQGALRGRKAHRDR